MINKTILIFGVMVILVSSSTNVFAEGITARIENPPTGTHSSSEELLLKITFINSGNSLVHIDILEAFRCIHNDIEIEKNNLKREDSKKVDIPPKDNITVAFPVKEYNVIQPNRRVGDWKIYPNFIGLSGPSFGELSPYPLEFKVIKESEIVPAVTLSTTLPTTTIYQPQESSNEWIVEIYNNYMGPIINYIGGILLSNTIPVIVTAIIIALLSVFVPAIRKKLPFLNGAKKKKNRVKEILQYVVICFISELKSNEEKFMGRKYDWEIAETKESYFSHIHPLKVRDEHFKILLKELYEDDSSIEKEINEYNSNLSIFEEKLSNLIGSVFTSDFKNDFKKLTAGKENIVAFKHPQFAAKWIMNKLLMKAEDFKSKYEGTNDPDIWIPVLEELYNKIKNKNIIENSREIINLSEKLKADSRVIRGKLITMQHEYVKEYDILKEECVCNRQWYT